MKNQKIAHPFTEKCLEKLEILRGRGNYRYFLDINKSAKSFPVFEFEGADGIKRSAVNWCSNDYLGFSTDEDIIAAATSVTIRAGAGSGGTRNISGTTIYHRQLEVALARLHQQESALIFNSAYMANMASLATLGEAFPDTVFISDAENHASLIEGMRLSRCEKHVFKHNDIAHLNEILNKIPINKPKIVVFESVYSMSGTIAPIADIVALAQKYNALTYCDEVHAVGLYGEKGEGMIAAQGHTVDIVNGTFAKAFGSVGGYITGSAVLMDYIRSFGKGFIFTSSLPPSVCVSVLKSIEKLVENKDILIKFHQNVATLREVLTANGVYYDGEKSHITRIPIGDSQKCKDIADILLYEHAIYLQPINPPTVPHGESCLRIICTARHTKHQINALAKSLKTLLY
jgi:5-aminolevulinate synthase